MSKICNRMELSCIVRVITLWRSYGMERISCRELLLLLFTFDILDIKTDVVPFIFIHLEKKDITFPSQLFTFISRFIPNVLSIYLKCFVRQFASSLIIYNSIIKNIGSHECRSEVNRVITSLRLFYGKNII